MIGKKSEKKRPTLTCCDFTDITAPCEKSVNFRLGNFHKLTRVQGH